MVVDSRSDGGSPFTLIDADGAPYLSPSRGTLGGHRGSKIFGRLDCTSALRALARGGYASQRVFFRDAETATSAGYRPSAICMPDAEVRLVETRVLVRREDGWHGLPYVWNAEETEATLQRTGAILQLTLSDDDAEVPLTYVVPDVNQCASCHATNHSTRSDRD